MNVFPPRTRLFCLALFSALTLAGLSAQDAAWLGLWEGRIRTAQGDFPARLEIFPGGALLDLPEQGAFGWPVRTVKAESRDLYIAVDLGMEPLELAGPREGEAVAGTLIQGGRSGRFEFRLARSGPSRDGERSFDTGRGILPGTLLLPPGGSGPRTLAVLLPDSGTTDRDGNNWQVPGRNDSLRLLAEALAEADIASYRYDKRGAGKAYRLGEDEAALTFEDHVRDAAACIRSFDGDPRFDRILVFGLGDGALVGAAALRGSRADALAAQGVSGRGLRDMIREASAGAPPEYQAEIIRIIAELDAGRFVDSVSPFLQNLFRRSFQPYLASWLRYDLGKELAGLTARGLPVLLMQGDLDLQVTLEDFDRLRVSVPEAEAVLLPGTNHILKLVGNAVDENYDSFSDPSYPLSPGVVPALADFLERVPKRAILP
ncbi:MAG: alpha/beta hydrolase [Treponema sp.]|nr:alpha/beta hydrolase [Treponema sp.]